MIERIEEFVKDKNGVKTVKKINTTFNIWVTEVRRLQSLCPEVKKWKYGTIKCLHTYYNSAYLPKEALKIMYLSSTETLAHQFNRLVNS